MEERNDYCPVVGKCHYENVDIKLNSYFLIQPFDRNKEKRENAINDALTKFYGSDKKYYLRKSDSDINNCGVYCDICRKIKSCQFCIVDLTGELYNTIDESGKKEQKNFLRPNVALELGMAYGLNKHALIMSSKINGRSSIPSDIDFVRYIDIPLVEFCGWDGASQKLLDRLRECKPIIPIMKSLHLDNIKLRTNLKSYLERLLHLKQKLPYLKTKSFRINQIIYKEDMLVGIIKDAHDFKEGFYFNFYTLDNNIEEQVGQLICYHVQPNGIAQMHLYAANGGDYLNEVAKFCRDNEFFVLGEHRLELIIPKEIEQIKTEEIRNLLIVLNYIE